MVVVRRTARCSQRLPLVHGLDLVPPPRMARLLTKKEIEKLQSLGAQQMDVEARNMLLGFG